MVSGYSFQGVWGGGRLLSPHLVLQAENIFRLAGSVSLILLLILMIAAELASLKQSSLSPIRASSALLTLSRIRSFLSRSSWGNNSCLLPVLPLQQQLRNCLNGGWGKEKRNIPITHVATIRRAILTEFSNIKNASGSNIIGGGDE